MGQLATEPWPGHGGAGQLSSSPVTGVKVAKLGEKAYSLQNLPVLARPVTHARNQPARQTNEAAQCYDAGHTRQRDLLYTEVGDRAHRDRVHQSVYATGRTEVRSELEQLRKPTRKVSHLPKQAVPRLDGMQGPTRQHVLDPQKHTGRVIRPPGDTHLLAQQEAAKAQGRGGAHRIF